jgi:RHS repeat-associated protein
MRTHRIIAAVCLILTGVASASAQNYVFSSCSSGVTFRVSIGSITRATGPTPDGAGGHQFTYIVTGNYSLTRGQSIQVSSGVGTVSIGFTASPALTGPIGPFTTFILEAPNAAGTGGPGLGLAASKLSWRVTLQGAGDLLPSGLPQTLPTLSAWTLRTQNYIFGDGSALGQIDMFGNCPASSGGTPASGSEKALGDPSDTAGGCNCGDPINLGSGNLFEHVVDYQTVGPNKLSFTRYYNSMASTNTLATSLGPNWRSTYDRYLRIVSASSVTAGRQDGQQVSFTLSGGNWITETDIDLKLTNSGATWTLTDSGDGVETYRTASASQAVLQTIRARNGYSQNLEYNASSQLTTVTDSFNRRLSLTYDNGRLQTVTTPDGLTLTYGYSADGARLTSAGYSTSPATSQTYLYESTSLPSALTGIIDENGNRYATWTYDSSGRALSSQHGAGADLTKIAYNDTDGSRTVTFPLGLQIVYKFTTLQGVPKVTEVDRLATSAAPAATLKLTYDSNGYTASQTDWNGNLTSYVNDVRGRPTSIFEAAGTPQARSTTITYHPALRLPVRIVEPGVTTSLTYDDAGNLLTKTRTDTTTTAAPYSTNGAGRTWSYTWSNFLLASVQSPRTDVAAVTRFTYDTSGALTAITNALDQTTRITQHLPGGLPQTLLDPNGVRTELIYDARLRLLTSTVNTAAGLLATSYTYDAAGNTIRVTGPDGSAYTNTYDIAHRLTGVADLFGQSIAYTLDAHGDRTQSSVLDSSGKRQRTRAGSFDALGRLLRDTAGAGQTTNYSYDGNGNRLTVTDPLTRVTTQAFDALNRVIRITDPGKGVTSTSYDAHDRPTSITDPNGGVTTYVYDGFGDVIQRVSPDTGTTIYRYDPNGNRTQSIDGAGATTNYTYDALDRVTATAYPGDAAGNVTYTYDESGYGFGIGRLTTVTDAAGTLNRSYDERGNVVSETRVNGAVTLVTSYTYDAASRVASITYPSGWTVAYTRDAMGRPTAVTTQPRDGSAPVPVLVNAGYQPFGPVNALTFGNGVAGMRIFDLDYRITNLADAGSSAIQNLSYSYDAANSVSSIADGVTPAATQRFVYDALNRLTSATGGYGNLGYTYDSVDNRLTQSLGGSPATYTYAARSNQLASVSAGGAKQTIGYTKTGSINSFDPAAGTITSLAYNQAGRLATVTAGTNPIAQYTYNAFGQRLVKVGAATATTLYQYDRSGHLIEESDSQGNPQADYIYLDGLPVATLSPATGQLYFLHCDRLGAPQVATDANQSVVWTASYGPFGEMSAIPGLIVQNLRLPGQEFDIDTGLYHNGFRDYVPGWGRYLQPDPIGIAGGMNTYGYVRANPVNSTDRLGLFFGSGGVDVTGGQAGAAMACAQQGLQYGSAQCPFLYGPPADPGISIEDLDYGADALRVLAYAALVDPFTAPAAPFLLGGSICLKALSQVAEPDAVKLALDVLEEPVNPFFKPVVDATIKKLFNAVTAVNQAR